MEGATVLNLAQKHAELKKPKPHKVDIWVANLDDEDTAEFWALVLDEEVKTSPLFAILQPLGIGVSKETFTAWRRANGYTR